MVLRKRENLWQVTNNQKSIFFTTLFRYCSGKGTLLKLVIRILFFASAFITVQMEVERELERVVHNHGCQAGSMRHRLSGLVAAAIRVVTFVSPPSYWARSVEGTELAVSSVTKWWKIPAFQRFYKKTTYFAASSWWRSLLPSRAWSAVHCPCLWAGYSGGVSESRLVSEFRNNGYNEITTYYGDFYRRVQQPQPFCTRGVWAKINFRAKRIPQKVNHVVFEVFSSFPTILAKERSKRKSLIELI